MKSVKYERLKSLGFDFGGPKQSKKPWMEQYEALVGKPTLQCIVFVNNSSPTLMPTYIKPKIRTCAESIQE